MPAGRISFPETISFKAPNGFVAALAEAAARDCTKPSDFIRRVVVEKLREAGIAVPTLPRTREEGSAHDRS